MLGVYCRVSKENEESTSIVHQQKKGIEFAKTNGWEYELYTDSGISGGAKTEDRPAFLRLINDIKEGKLLSVYIWNNDRAARQETTWFGLVELLTSNDIQLYENGQLIDLSDPSVQLVQGVKAIVNANYRRELSKKFKDRLLANVKEGKVVSWNLPYGYTKDENKYLVLHPEESKIVAEVFNRINEGHTTNGVTNWLNDSKIPTRQRKIKGKIKIIHKGRDEVINVDRSKIIWKPTNIRRMIINPIYRGQRLYKGQYYPAPRIVSDDVWTNANSGYIERAKSHNKGKNTENIYLLPPLTVCKKCGKSMNGFVHSNKTNGLKFRYYSCVSRRYFYNRCGSSNVPLAPIDYIVTTDVFYHLYDYAKNHLEGDTGKLQGELKDRIRTITLELDKANKSIKRAKTFLIDGLIDKKDYNEQISRLNKLIHSKVNEKSQNEGALKSLESKSSIIEELETTHIKGGLEQLKNTEQPLKDVGEKFIKSGIGNLIDFQTRKQVIHKYVKNIEISTDNETKVKTIEIFYRLPLPSTTYYIGKRGCVAYRPLSDGLEFISQMETRMRYTSETRYKELEEIRRYLDNSNFLFP